MSKNLDIVNIWIKAGDDLNIQANTQFNQMTALNMGIALGFTHQSILDAKLLLNKNINTKNINTGRRVQIKFSLFIGSTKLN